MTASHGFEAMLLRWAETSNGGATIVLQLADPADLESFKSMTLAKKGMVGQRLMVGVAEIGDDEKPKDDSQWTPEQLAEAVAEGAAPLEIPKLKGGELSRLAGIWCLDERFQNWLQTFYMIAWTDAGAYEELDEERAAHVVRWLCAVTSRADLDHNAEAKALFDELFRIPYSQYLKENA